MTDTTRPLVASVIADHRKVIIAEVAYSVRDVAKFLGISYYAVQRLIAGGKIRTRNTGRHYIIPGAAIIDYLDGRDEPMQHKDSA